MGERKAECFEPNGNVDGSKGEREFISSSAAFPALTNNNSEEILHHPSQHIDQPVTMTMRELLEEEQGMQIMTMRPPPFVPANHDIRGGGGKPNADDGKLLSVADLICKKILKTTRLYFAKWTRCTTKDVATGLHLPRKLPGSKHLVRFPCAGHGKLTSEQVMHQGIEEIELCKKKILMGEKCRPLNKSGSLHYDENGILLAEET